ncbi:signal peptidase I [Chloroflexota bacterium]
MSSFSDSQKPNSLPESDPSDSDHSADSINADDGRSLVDETPLPVFDQGNSNDNPPLNKALAETLPELEAILRNEKPELDLEPPPPQHIYQISSAEKNWSEYPVPYLDDGELPEQQEETQSGWTTAWAVVREIGETILLTLIIFFLIQTVIRNFRVVGTSMIDNLHDGQYLIIDKLTYSEFYRDTLGWGGPRHGDVIVFEPPNRPDEDYVKRIVGLPGETIEVKDGKIFIDGEELAEPFLPKVPRYQVSKMVIPEGHVYVLGDNRNNSNDSHNWGVLPIENIVGRAWLSYWPPDQWGVIPHDAPTEEATLKYFLSEIVPDANAGSE